MKKDIISYIDKLIKQEKILSEKTITGSSWKDIFQKCDQKDCLSNIRILRKIKRYINKIKETTK